MRSEVKKVMLDFDLAEMYEVTTGNFNKASLNETSNDFLQDSCFN